MFREFNVKFEDVEILGGADNLLESTEVTKVITRGDNKMSSLDSMLKDCNELDTIDGELDLNGVSDIDNLLEGTELVKSINLKNINNENITANNSFPYVESINIGGEVYDKRAMQNVIASKDWTFDNITYSGNVGENLLAKSATMIDDDKTTIKNTLEQKARGFEIIGQTYENLVVGSGEATLLDELTLESVDGSPNEFTPHIEQPVCVEAIEGETYQNLIDGKGEYKLTDTFSTTWTGSNDSIENAPSMIEIPEIWGNTVQGYVDLLSAKTFVEHFNNIKWTSSSVYAEFYSDNTFKVIRNIDYYSTEIQSAIASDSSKAIKLKPTTKYTIWVDNGNCSLIVATPSTIPLDSVETRLGSYTFTTDSTGLIGIGLKNTNSTLKTKIRLIEGEIANLHEISHDFNLNYIQSVGDLYVDESGEPILDEEGNEQYKLEIISHGYVTDSSNSRSIVQNLFLSSSETFTNISVYAGTPLKAYFQCIAKMDLSKSKTGYFCTFVQGGANGIKYYSTDHSLKFLYENNEYFLGIINHNEPFSITIKQVNSDTSLLVYFNGIEKVSITSTIFAHGNFVAFNSRYHTGIGGGCGSMNIIYAQCSKNVAGYIGVDEDDWANINKWNKTTILMPQPLRRAGYERYGYNNNGNQYDKPIRDLLYYDTIEKKFFIKKYVMTNYRTDTSFIEDSIYRQYNTREIIPPVSINQTLGHVYAIRYFSESLDKSKLKIIFRGGNTSQSALLATLREEFTVEESNALFSDVAVWYAYYKNDTELYYETVETKILEKPSLETYSPKTYITTNTEIQPSQMSITNKKVDFIPLGLQPNKDYTLQLDSTGKEDKPITVNLGGAETTIQPINDTSKHHKVVVRTPSTLTTDKLDLSGEGVVVNDVMLFEGNTSAIKQDVNYIEGIQSIGEPFESRNLFDYTQSELGLLDHTNGNISEDNSWKYTTDFISVKPNTTYCISQTSGSVFNYKIVEYNSSKAYLKGTNWTSSKGTDINRAYNTFTTSANTYYLRLGWQSSIFEIQLEADTFPTEFMAFDTVRYKLEIQTYDSTWDKL